MKVPERLYWQKVKLSLNYSVNNNVNMYSDPLLDIGDIGYFKSRDQVPGPN